MDLCGGGIYPQWSLYESMFLVFKGKGIRAAAAPNTEKSPNYA